jgi:3-deoxy-D-manno-octulosonate 8-phosphate phosphatase (KDO 8-P phosphatase)
MIADILLSNVRLVAFDFDGVFTDNCVIVNQFGEESVKCWRSDGLGLTRLKSIGVEILILSTETNLVVQKRAEKLNVTCIQAVKDKALVLEQYCTKLGIELSNTMFVGNDINDISAFKIVGIPVGVADAYPEVIDSVISQTKRSGGYGAVREICDLIYFAKKGNVI